MGWVWKTYLTKMDYLVEEQAVCLTNTGREKWVFEEVDKLHFLLLTFSQPSADIFFKAVATFCHNNAYKGKIL